MQKKKLFLFILILIIVYTGCDSFLGPPSGAKEETTLETDLTLESGQTGTGYLREGKSHNWTFTAETGDYIIVSVGDADGADGALTPEIILIAPSGTELGNNHGTNGDSVWKKATESGTYTITIKDYEDNDAGNYNVSLVISGGTSTPSTGDEGGVIAAGATEAGKLTLGELDAWTFEATTGDYIAVSAGDSEGGDGALTPEIVLIAPSGTELGNNHGISGDSVWKNATETGTYTIVVHDYEDNDTGNYSVSLILSGTSLTISSGDEGNTLVSGTTISSALTLGELDGWTFSADTGDYISASAGDADGENGAITPEIVLISPSGVELGNNHGISGDSIWKKASETGLYTLVVHDYEDNDTGNYNLSLIVSGDELTISTGDEGSTINSGETLNGVLALGELDGYTFNATAGDYIAVSAGDADGDDGAITPEIVLIDPSGTELGNNHGINGDSVWKKATTTGLYTLVVHDYEDNDSGNYSITLILSGTDLTTTTGDQGGKITSLRDKTVTGSITMGELDGWIFTAQAESYLSIGISDADGESGALTPEVCLIAPSGSLLKSDHGINTADFTIKLTESGSYLVIIHDYEDNDTGNYSLYLNTY